LCPRRPGGGDDGRILALNSVGGVDSDDKMHGIQKIEKNVKQGAGSVGRMRDLRYGNSGTLGIDSLRRWCNIFQATATGRRRYSTLGNIVIL
jgi:hypothetical protein